MPTKEFKHEWETIKTANSRPGVHIYEQIHSGRGGRRTLMRTETEDGEIRVNRIDNRDQPIVTMYDNPATNKPIWQVKTPDGTERTFESRNKTYTYLMGWHDNDTPNANQALSLTRISLDMADRAYNEKLNRMKEQDNVRT